MAIEFKPIGYVKTDTEKVPRHWTVSDVEGSLIIEDQYREGLTDIKPGEKIVVLFHFHKSQDFDSNFLRRKPPHHNEIKGVFSICSPVRPNPIGLSVLEVLEVKGTEICVKGLDMINNTPILDIKPHVKGEYH